MKLFDKTMKMFSLLCILMMIGIISCDDNGVIRLVVRVGEDVILPCSLVPKVDSQFKGRVSYFPDKLENGDADIVVIRNLQLSDSGNYSCFVKQHLQQQRFYVELVVGIFAEPRVMILEITEDWALLQCEVHGAIPKPQISWIDSDGVVLNAEEKLKDSDGLQCPSTLMLQTNVTKTGNFSCRVTQKKLDHITEAHISVFIFCEFGPSDVTDDETMTGSNGGLLGVAIVGWILFALGLVVVGIYCWCRRRAKRVSARQVIQPTTQKPHSSLEEEDVSCSFLPQPVDNQDRLDHSPLLGHSRDQPGPPVSSSPSAPLPARKIPDSDDSSLSSSRAPESRDSGFSFRYSSCDTAKPEETREPTPELEPDKAVKIPMEEFK